MTHLETLLGLCGMKHKSGYYTPEEWEEITGVNPRGVRGIELSKWGKCVWTSEAEAIVKAYFDSVSCDREMLTSGRAYMLARQEAGPTWTERERMERDPISSHHPDCQCSRCTYGDDAYLWLNHPSEY